MVMGITVYDFEEKKVGQMLPSPYISSLLSLYLMILHLISYFNECMALFMG